MMTEVLLLRGQLKVDHVHLKELFLVLVGSGLGAWYRYLLREWW